MLKRIQAAVGFGGRNLPADVMTVQYLLNCVPAVQGGPIRELAVDGIAGPITMAAIRKFQLAMFGRADGRIDPGRDTLATLLPYDPLPNEPVMLTGGIKKPSRDAAFIKFASEMAAHKGMGEFAHKVAMKSAYKGFGQVAHKGIGEMAYKVASQVAHKGMGDVAYKMASQVGHKGAGEVAHKGAPGAWGPAGKIGVGGKFGS